MTKNNKNNIADRVLSVRIPARFFNKFQKLCDDNFRSMSDTMRDFVRKYIKEGNK